MFAESIDQIVSDLSKIENVQHQFIDKEMLGQAGDNMPAFMQKGKDIVIVRLFGNLTQEELAELIKEQQKNYQ